MPLIEKTEKVKALSLLIKSNFCKIGCLLKEIRDSAVFKEKYSTFTEYLDSEDFQFSRQHAYKFISVFEAYGDDARMRQVPLRTLIQLTYVSDRTERKELESEAVEVYSKKKDVQQFYDKVKRVTQRLKDNVEVIEDSAELKCERQLRELSSDLTAFNKTAEYLDNRFIKLKESALRWPGNKVILSLVQEIDAKWGYYNRK